MNSAVREASTQFGLPRLSESVEHAGPGQRAAEVPGTSAAAWSVKRFREVRFSPADA